MKKSSLTKDESAQPLRDLSYCVEPLLNWYEKQHRDLPWRREVTPYRVWVSEIMLQQTRVEAVKPYFAKFMEKLPSIEMLAQAQTDDLLKLWEGLGYYSRVRNMQKAAIQICEQYNGRMPDTYEELLKLPGIGSYTAGAIGSIAYNLPVPAVDGNVLRVLSRLTMDEADIADVKVKKRVFEELMPVMPKESGMFNQALMELGATVCGPNGTPSCKLCPWENICQAHKVGKELEFPVKAPKKARTIEQKTILIIRDGEKLLLHKRANKGLLAGLYEFPMIEGFQGHEDVIVYVRALGFEPLFVQQISNAKHIFTHKEWHMKGYVIKVEPFDESKKQISDDFYVVHPNDVKEAYSIPSAFSAFTPYVGIELTKDEIKRYKKSRALD